MGDFVLRVSQICRDSELPMRSHDDKDNYSLHVLSIFWVPHTEVEALYASAYLTREPPAGQILCSSSGSDSQVTELGVETQVCLTSRAAPAASVFSAFPSCGVCLLIRFLVRG